MSAAAYGLARMDLATICGRGIRAGERVKVSPSWVEGRVTITAAGGRRVPHVTPEQADVKVDVVHRVGSFADGLVMLAAMP